MTAERSRFARQFVLVRGRTRSSVALPLDTLLTATKNPPWSDLTTEQRDIYDRCKSPLSVAELAAALEVHLGIARVLAGDLIEMGALSMQSGLDNDEEPDLETLEQVFNDLSNLITN